MCISGQSLIKAEDMTSNSYWIVPQKVLAIAPDVIPVHKVLGLTEEKFEAFNRGQGGNMPWKRFNGVIVPVHEILDLTEEEFSQFSQGQGGMIPDHFIKPAEEYNPPTWNASVSAKYPIF